MCSCFPHVQVLAVGREVAAARNRRGRAPGLRLDQNRRRVPANVPGAGFRAVRRPFTGALGVVAVA